MDLPGMEGLGGIGFYTFVSSRSWVTELVHRSQSTEQTVSLTRLLKPVTTLENCVKYYDRVLGTETLSQSPWILYRIVFVCLCFNFSFF